MASITVPSQAGTITQKTGSAGGHVLLTVTPTATSGPRVTHKYAGIPEAEVADIEVNDAVTINETGFTKP